jgi:hypothetical protein
MSNTHNICPECSSLLTSDINCRDYFNQMLTWDFEDPEDIGKLLHLTVLCYHIQHPSLYSSEALKFGKHFLRSIIERNMSAKELLEITRKSLAASKRTWKIKGIQENRGSYQSKLNGQ